jgi:hypothetical protein
MLAHAGTPDEQVALVTVVAGLWIGWAGLSRIRDKGFGRIPIGAAWLLALFGVAVMIGGLTLPRQFLKPNTASATPSGPRPTSTASLVIARPTEGQRVATDQIEVVMELSGGRIVASASTTLTPDTGHVHVSLDGTLVSMTYGLVQVVDLTETTPGEHTLEAEFVAADHGPFDPRVIASVTFTKANGS